MRLQFPADEIAYWAKRYSYRPELDILALKPQIKKCGFLTLEQLGVVASWKSPRSSGQIDNNDDDFVKTITGFALQTKNERAKIESLTLLDGVRWPTASLILHFFDCEKYPVLDFRALWSVGIDPPPPYDFSFWWKYVMFCRGLSDRSGQDMRILDKALWAYSKAKQPSKSQAE